ncbi:Neutral/alkaline nonlysosomal ceramidase [Spinellus fusiger]|nr:Neutral/alkaline nonlysosomal ceramidase [Spinellus fusiger]
MPTFHFIISYSLMKIISFCFIFLFFYSIAAESSQDDYWIGTGMGDITGPIVQIMMMGYAKKGQTGEGLLQRLYARAYIVIDPDSGSRVVFVNTDTQSMGDIVKQRVVESLQEIHGKTMYTEHNVMLASTHSHSGMGGYLQYTLYEISVYGWIEETVGPMVTGIVHAIEQAHNNLQKGSLTYYLGQLLDTNINRSQKAYLLNPEKEREEYQYDVDKEMRMIGFQGKKEPLGLISWFPVHGVSINGTNRLINGDNKGFASYAIEKKMNPDKVTGKGPFVAAFPQVNAGDFKMFTRIQMCGQRPWLAEKSF